MSGILFATDLDKTLLDDEARVPPICVDAIRSYVQKGGLFTIATGRPTRGALLYPEIIDLVNAPIITYNGACIYDTRKKRTIWRRLLPDTFPSLLRAALEQFPKVGALVFRGEDDLTCAVRSNIHIQEISWKREHYNAAQRTLDEIDLPWNKVVIAGEPEDMALCKAFIEKNTPTPITIILSEKRYLELTGPNVGKEKALRRVAESLRIDLAHVVAIGDSMNDIEMIRWAGTGVAVANAEDEMKRQAAFIVPSNVHYGICTCIQNIVLPMLSNS